MGEFFAFLGTTLGAIITIAIFYGKQVNKVKHLEEINEKNQSEIDKIDVLENKVLATELTIVELRALINVHLARVNKIDLLEQIILQHKERFESVTRDHNHLDDSLEKVSTRLQENSETVAALEATMKGLQAIVQSFMDHSSSKTRKR